MRTNAAQTAKTDITIREKTWSGDIGELNGLMVSSYPAPPERYLSTRLVFASRHVGFKRLAIDQNPVLKLSLAGSIGH